MAAFIVEIMGFYFPDSFDRLEREQAASTGPKPVFIESDRIEDLSMLLYGNQESTRIGSRKVLLVRDEKSLESLPSELDSSLVLTISQAKGLEFEQVILFDFFASSPFSLSKWKVLREFQVDSHGLGQQFITDSSFLSEVHIVFVSESLIM